MISVNIKNRVLTTKSNHLSSKNHDLYKNALSAAWADLRMGLSSSKNGAFVQALPGPASPALVQKNTFTCLAPKLTGLASETRKAGPVSLFLSTVVYKKSFVNVNLITFYFLDMYTRYFEKLKQKLLFFARQRTKI